MVARLILAYIDVFMEDADSSAKLIGLTQMVGETAYTRSNRTKPDKTSAMREGLEWFCRWHPQP